MVHECFNIKYTAASFKTQLYDVLDTEITITKRYTSDLLIVFQRTFSLTDTERFPKDDSSSVLKTHITPSIHEKTQHFLRVILLFYDKCKNKGNVS